MRNSLGLLKLKVQGDEHVRKGNMCEQSEVFRDQEK
jgi:hypothetical protein